MMMSSKNVLAYSAAACMLILSASALLDAAQKARPQRVVEAQEFRIRGANGKILASLHGEDGQATLSLSDSEGIPRIMLSVQDGGTAVVIVGDARNKANPKASLTVLKGKSAAMSLSGNGLVIAAVKPDANPGIEVLDGSDRVLFQTAKAAK